MPDARCFTSARASPRSWTTCRPIWRNCAAWTRGLLNIAVTSTVNAVATDILGRFRSKHPKVSIHLDVSNRESVLGQLAANRIDLAIMGQVPDGLDLEATRFMDNPLVVIAPPDHPLASKKTHQRQESGFRVFPGARSRLRHPRRDGTFFRRTRAWTSAPAWK